MIRKFLKNFWYSLTFPVWPPEIPEDDPDCLYEIKDE